MQKATHDHSVSGALFARLDQIGLRYGVDPSTFPPMPPFLEELSQPSMPAEPPYQEEDKDEE